MAKVRRGHRFYDWVEGTLLNDEESTDEELTSHFMREGHLDIVHIC
jgi:hypothetical protein